MTGILATGVYSFVEFARLEFATIPTSARSPWQNGYAERLIGSIRRELLDHVVVTGEQYLRHILTCYMDYYNYGSHAPLVREGMHPKEGPFSAMGVSRCGLSSADSTISTSGSDLR